LRPRIWWSASTGDKLFPALETLDRVVQIAQILRDQMRVLGSLSPVQFQVIRRSLGNEA